MTNDRIEKAYSENGPLPEGRREAIGKIKAETKSLAYAIDGACPDGREKSLAQTKLEEACMWAVKAVAHAEGE